MKKDSCSLIKQNNLKPSEFIPLSSSFFPKCNFQEGDTFVISLHPGQEILHKKNGDMLPILIKETGKIEGFPKLIPIKTVQLLQEERQRQVFSYLISEFFNFQIDLYSCINRNMMNIAGLVQISEDNAKFISLSGCYETVHFIERNLSRYSNNDRKDIAKNQLSKVQFDLRELLIYYHSSCISLMNGNIITDIDIERHTNLKQQYCNTLLTYTKSLCEELVICNDYTNESIDLYCNEIQRVFDLAQSVLMICPYYDYSPYWNFENIKNNCVELLKKATTVKAYLSIHNDNDDVNINDNVIELHQNK